MARKIKLIFVHTLAFDGDAGWDWVDRVHRARGWLMGGYNAVIRRDGRVERGRAEWRVPAGVRGFNKHSLHVACEGHGDHTDFTIAQKVSIVKVLADWIEKYLLVERFVKNPSLVLGHREAWTLLLDRRALKTCPGTKVDMREVRLLTIEEGKRRGWYGQSSTGDPQPDDILVEEAELKLDQKDYSALAEKLDAIMAFLRKVFPFWAGK